MSKPHELVTSLLFIVVLAWTSALLGVVHANPRSIRSVEVDDKSVTVVHTAIGYSTILEFESKPTSAVLGDQDSFKLEYVGNSITLKPLVPQAKTNLFVFTQYLRLNCQIVSGPPNEVDYIVRFRSKSNATPLEIINPVTPAVTGSKESGQFSVRKIQKSSSSGGLRFTLLSISQERDLSKPRSVTLIDFEVSSESARSTLQPNSITAQQGGKSLNFESMYLDHLELTPNAPVHGKLALLSRDFNPLAPVTLIIHDPKANRHIAVSTETPRPPKLKHRRLQLAAKAKDPLGFGDIGTRSGKDK